MVLGAGDRGTATGLRLFRAGLKPLLLESANPADLHYFRNFSDLVYCEKKQIEDINGLYLGDTNVDKNAIRYAFNDRNIPLLTGLSANMLEQIKPEIVIDCRKPITENDALAWRDFPYVIKIGIRYNVGIDGHVIVGEGLHDQGRVYYKRHDMAGEEDTLQEEIRAPIEGVFVAKVSPGEHVKIRQDMGAINEISILAPQDGYIAGILHSGHYVPRHQPLVEIQPAGRFHPDIREIPLNNVAVSGGVLEAVLSYIKRSAPATW